MFKPDDYGDYKMLISVDVDVESNVLYLLQ